LIGESPSVRELKTAELGAKKLCRKGGVLAYTGTSHPPLHLLKPRNSWATCVTLKAVSTFGIATKSAAEKSPEPLDIDEDLLPHPDDQPFLLREVVCELLAELGPEAICAILKTNHKSRSKKYAAADLCRMIALVTRVSWGRCPSSQTSREQTNYIISNSKTAIKSEIIPASSSLASPSTKSGGGVSPSHFSYTVSN
jgi:hypothetical protein